MLLLNNEEVEQALTPQDAIAATESIYRELAEGKALNRARSQVYLPAESREHPGFHYRRKTGASIAACGRCASRRIWPAFRTPRVSSGGASCRSRPELSTAAW